METSPRLGDGLVQTCFWTRCRTDVRRLVGMETGTGPGAGAAAGIDAGPGAGTVQVRVTVAGKTLNPKVPDAVSSGVNG